MICIENLSFAYGHTEILKDISFSAEAGECVGILGNNGAGKSTLITCINRIRKMRSGKITINGKDLSAMSRKTIAQTVAYVAQKNEMTNATVFDCVLLGRTPYIKWTIGQEDIDLCERTIEQLGIRHLKLRNVDQLSGGEMQKVMLARALVQEPKVLLLDEPTSNLDPRNQYEMLALVRRIAKEQGITVLIVIHDLNLALRYCDRFYFLKDRVGFSYGGIETVTAETIQTVYGISAEIAQVNGRQIVVLD